MGKYAVVQPQPRPDVDKRPLQTAGVALSLTYLITTTTLIGSAVLCLLSPPPPPRDAAGTSVPSNAVCLRASRYADYATARVIVGTPARETEVFLRLDRVVDESATATTLWASTVSQSSTLNCTSEGSECTDIGIAQTAGVESAPSTVRLGFSLFGDYADYSSMAGARLGLKGTMHLVRGYDYFLTTTHFCWAPHGDNVSGTHGFRAVVDTYGYLEESEGKLGRCNGTSTHLFPYYASKESLWLALKDRYLYEHDEVDLALRRAVVEKGIACSIGNATLYRALVLYRQQCESSGVCQTLPSAPYRRIAARHTVFLQLPHHTPNATILFQNARTMARLPALLSSNDATWIAVGQLAILVLVAAVSFVRSSQKAVSPAYILKHAFNRCVGEPATLSLHSLREVVLNAMIGALALGARSAVVAFSAEDLSADNANRVVLAEVVGCLVSFAHFVLRNVVLHTELKFETPLTKLGGPMSTIDISCAILVSLAETPLLATRETFSSVGRMLASLLILVSGVQTLIYSAAACVMTAVCVTHERDYMKRMKGFATVLYTASILWTIQAACVGITLCTVFVAPFVFSVSRIGTGDTTVLRIATLFGIFATALPMVNRVTLQFVREIVKQRESQDQADEAHALALEAMKNKIA